MDGLRGKISIQLSSLAAARTLPYVERKDEAKKSAVKGEKQLGFWSQLPPGVCPRSGFVSLDVRQQKRFPQNENFLRFL